MEKEKCIIKKIRGKNHFFNKHIAEISGERTYKSPDYYENILTGERYAHIGGGIGFPIKNTPGFIIIVGVEKTEDPDPAFICLDEAEHNNIEDLLCACIALRKRWGYPECVNLIYGDYERYTSILSKFNLKENQTTKKWKGVIISPPLDFEKNNAVEIYLQQLRLCLLKDNPLIPKRCKKLMGYLQTLSPDIDNSGRHIPPAILALGGLIHTLAILEPWKRNVTARPRSYVDYAQYYHLRIMKGLQHGGLIPTIKGE